MSKLRDMLFTSAHADRAKALLTLDILENHPAGIGDHSTDDFYKILLTPVSCNMSIYSSASPKPHSR